MRRVRWASILLLGLLLPTPAVALGQLAGDAGRSGTVDVPAGPFDVVATGSILNASEELAGLMYQNAFMAMTGDGLFAITSYDGDCYLLRLQDPRNPVPLRAPLEGCRYGIVSAYVEATQVLLVCSMGTDTGGLLAYDANSLELLWSYRPEGRVDPAAGPVTVIGQFWRCHGTAVDPHTGEIVAAFITPNTNDHAIVSIDLKSGQENWVRRLDTRLFYSGPTASVHGTGGSVLRSSPYTGDALQFIPLVVTMMPNGLVVTGQALCACGRTADARQYQYAAAWLTREGLPIGGILAEDDPTLLTSGQAPSEFVPGGSQFAASHGTLALYALGGRMLLINPETTSPILVKPIEALEPLSAWVNRRGTVWTDDTAIVPLPHTVTAVDPHSLERRWAWSQSARQVVTAVAATTGGELLVLTADVSSAEPHAMVSRLNLADGALLQQVRLPIVPIYNDGGWRASMVPIGGGEFAILDDAGNYALISQQPDAHLVPHIEADTIYPKPGAPVSLQLAAPAVTSWSINWGDGRLVSLPAGEPATHIYGSPGTRQVEATAHYQTGLTATTSLLLHVGTDPPPALNVMQRAFAPENQDTTWGAIGIAIALIGTVIGVGRNRLGRSQLNRQLDELAAIARAGQDGDPGALAELGAYRGRMRRDLARGRLDDTQYGVLDQRANRIAVALRHRLLAPLHGALSAAFRGLLEAAFEDDWVSVEEARRLLDALPEEKGLDRAQQDHLRRLIEAWG